jgi:hypothetical protein
MNPYLIIALGAAWILSLMGVGKWQNTAGHVAERAEWQGKEMKELASANAEILRLDKAYRESEKDKATALSVISTVYEGKLNDAAKQKDRDVAAARAVAPQYQLRYATTSGACADRSIAPTSTPAPLGRDGPATAQLPGEIAANLFALADDADALVDQLTACQAVVMADRRE